MRQKERGCCCLRARARSAAGRGRHLFRSSRCCYRGHTLLNFRSLGCLLRLCRSRRFLRLTLRCERKPQIHSAVPAHANNFNAAAARRRAATLAAVPHGVSLPFSISMRCVRARRTSLLSRSSGSLNALRSGTGVDDSQPRGFSPKARPRSTTTWPRKSFLAPRSRSHSSSRSSRQARFDFRFASAVCTGNSSTC